jgi:hypothetical protein
VHLALVTNTTWVKAFLNGKAAAAPEAVMAISGAPPAQGKK